MSITWTLVKRITLLYPLGWVITSPLSITCMGQGRMLATFQEFGAPNPPGQFALRPFRSTDNGLTWTELATLPSNEDAQIGRLRCPGVLNQALLGMRGPMAGNAYDPLTAVITRTLDGGQSWASAVTPAEFAADNFLTNSYMVTDVVITDFGTLFAFGSYSIPGLRFVMRSTDGGATFTNPTTLPPLVIASDVRHGVYLGNGILCASEQNHTPLDVLRSTDAGATWARAVLDAAQSGSINGACARGALGTGGGLLCGGQTLIAPPFTLSPFVYFTNTSGAAWLAGAIAGSAYVAQDVIAPSASLAVLGLDVSAAVIAGGGSPFRLSIDGGQTFPDQGVQATPFFPGVRYTVSQLAVADDGAVLAGVFTYDGTNTAPLEIWRGVIDGFTGPGPCAGFTGT